MRVKRALWPKVSLYYSNRFCKPASSLQLAMDIHHPKQAYTHLSMCARMCVVDMSTTRVHVVYTHAHDLLSLLFICPTHRQVKTGKPVQG